MYVSNDEKTSLILKKYISIKIKYQWVENNKAGLRPSEKQLS